MSTRAAAAFRPDIEGLRAIAITSVVLYHAGVGALSGGFVGVDLFFVLSGFLITGMLVRELEQTGGVDLREFWARRIRRLLPAASLVLVATAVVSIWAVAPTLRAKAADGIIWSTLYAANWFFVRDSLDYLAADDAASPVLHFWSLGVEEQFYFLWPIGLVLLAALLRRRRLPLRPWLALTAVAVIIGSLATSVVLTEVSQPWAFFGSPTRFWQLAIGAFLAIGARRWDRFGMRRRTALQTGGLLVLLGSMFGMGTIVERGFTYPGLAALLPTFATAAIVMAGTATTPTTGMTQRVLSAAPLQWVGARSYAWYLWHWPVIILWAQWRGDPGTIGNLLLGGVALVLAALTHRLVENPVRHAAFLKARPGLSLALGGLLMLGSIGSAQVLRLNDAEHIEQRLRASGDLGFSPAPSEAYEDISVLYAGECQLTYGRVSQPTCLYGDTKARQRIVLMGDSHATNMFAAVDAAARKLGYVLDARVKSRCTVSSVLQWIEDYQEPFTPCSAWREATLQDIEQRVPAAVILVTSSNPPPAVYDEASSRVLEPTAGRTAWEQGYRRTLQRVVATGTRVIVIRDNPRVPSSIPDCVARNLADPSACDFPRSFGLPEPAADRSVAATVPGVTVWDYSDEICDADTCFAVTRGMLAWQKGSHYTDSFARSMTARVAQDMRTALQSTQGR